MAVREIAYRHFHGGLNVRDAPSELDDNEFVDGVNVTLDERGGIWKRLGSLQKWEPFGASAPVQNLFNWAARGFTVVQIGAGMHKDNSAAFLTWSTTDRCGMTEFNGNLILIHPVDGVRIYDGTTVTGPFTNSPKGNVATTWQNKVFTGGDPVNPARVTWCAAGTPGTWNVNDWIELREKDTAKITNLVGSSGVDIQGRPGLLVFKEESTYRMHDSTTGAYTTIDRTNGCGGNIAAVGIGGRVYVVNDRGIFWTDGVRSLVEASSLVDTFFSSKYINVSRSDLMAAGRYGDRLWFSLPRVGASVNGIAFEVSPQGEWIVRHTNAASCYSTDIHGVGGHQMVMGHPTTNGLVLNANEGGHDNGTPIASAFQTRWIEPNAGSKSRIRRLRFIGKGTFTAYVYKDYQDVAGTAGRFVGIDTPGSNVKYDDGHLYDAPTSIYAAQGFQAYKDEFSFGVAQAASIRIEETSSLTQLRAELLGSGLAPISGAWNLSQIHMRAIDLGDF